MYEAVRLQAGGDTTPARFAATAVRYGFDGLVYLRPPAVEPPDLTPISAEYDLDLGDGVMVTAGDRGSASQAITRLRDDVDVLCVTAETADRQRFVAEQERVDVLRWRPGNGDVIGQSVARTAADHGVYIELDLGPVLRTAGGRRVRAIRDLQQAATVVDHYEVPVVVSGGPTTHLALRSPRELRAVSESVDLPPSRVSAGCANWGAILERSRRARSDTFIEPGVRRTPNETDDR